MNCKRLDWKTERKITGKWGPSSALNPFLAKLAELKKNFKD